MLEELCTVKRYKMGVAGENQDGQVITQESLSLLVMKARK